MKLDLKSKIFIQDSGSTTISNTDLCSAFNDVLVKKKQEINFWEISYNLAERWAENNKLYDELTYKGFSLWPGFRKEFFIWFNGLLQHVEAALTFCDLYQPREVQLINAPPLMQDAFICVCNHRTILLTEGNQLTTTCYSSMGNVLFFIKQKLPIYFLMAIRMLQGIIRYQNWKKLKEKKVDIMGITYSLSFLPLGKSESRNIYDDVQIGPLIRKVSNKRDVIAIDIFTKKKILSGLKTFLQKRFPYLPEETFMMLKFRKRDAKVKAHLKNLTESSLTYRGVELQPLLEKIYKKVFKPKIIKTTENISYWRKIFKKLLRSNGLIILSDEMGGGQALVIAAKVEGFKTLATQHGAIHDFHVSYILPESCKYKKIPICDMTSVYGRHAREVLTKKSIYQPDNVIVNGQLKLDLLYQNKKSYDRVRFLKRLNIPVDAKTIVYTSNFKSISKTMTLDLLFSSYEDSEKIYALIKPHPAESDYKVYYELAKKYNVPVLVSEHFELYEILSCSDLLVSTMPSTTIFDAIICQVPVLVLNVPGAVTVFDELKGGLVESASTRDEVKKKIEELLEKKPGQPDNKERKKFIEEHYGKIDGLVGERMDQTVEKMLSK